MLNAIEIKNLNFSYPDNQKVLFNINMVIRSKETVGIIGPSGTGKTTLLHHFNGNLQGEGSVKILQYPVNKKNIRQIRRAVGIVTQNPDDQLFSPTVFDDVAFGPLNLNFRPTDVFKTVKKALGSVDMQEWINAIPHHLSFGQKKKIALASIIVMNPKILVLDEPTSNLDALSQDHIIKVIRKFTEKTIIIASHDLSLIKKLCSRIIILQKGCIVADDSCQKVLSNKKLLMRNGLLV